MYRKSNERRLWVMQLGVLGVRCKPTSPPLGSLGVVPEISENLSFKNHRMLDSDTILT